MLQEIEVTQPEPGRRRRWFADENLDLLVWEDEDGITGFRLCYDKKGTEHALSWSRDGQFRHEAVDTGEDDPLRNRTPVLVPDGQVPAERLRSLFTAGSAGLPETISARVRAELARLDDG